MDLSNLAHKRLLLIGLLALAITSISAATMFSMALLTDNATVDDNTFTTGTIDISTTPATALFNVSGMMPGDSVYGQLNVANSGTGQLRYAMTSSSTDDSQHLADQVTLEIRQKAAGTCASDFTGTVVMPSTALSGAAFGDPATGSDTGDRVLNTSASENLCFKASLPGSTDDSYQGATTTTTFTFSAEQTANN
jgi:predicted ribosomally synthesized peptide with SipW-like signal peptide